LGLGLGLGSVWFGSGSGFATHRIAWRVLANPSSGFAIYMALPFICQTQIACTQSPLWVLINAFTSSPQGISFIKATQNHQILS
jgi:hypothetical protein